MAGPAGISCWGPNLTPNRGDFAAESSFSRKAQPKLNEVTGATGGYHKDSIAVRLMSPGPVSRNLPKIVCCCQRLLNSCFADFSSSVNLGDL
jgi:hypothetical protein